MKHSLIFNPDRQHIGKTYGIADISIQHFLLSDKPFFRMQPYSDALRKNY